VKRKATIEWECDWCGATATTEETGDLRFASAPEGWTDGKKNFCSDGCLRGHARGRTEADKAGQRAHDETLARLKAEARKRGKEAG
jgi:hypothetical protein